MLPFFLPKEQYGEIEFIKFTAFLLQFSLLGAGTGYIVSYFDKSKEAEVSGSFFVLGVVVSSLITGVLMACFVHWAMGIVAVAAVWAIAAESMIKVKERYLLAMAFKPLLSISLILILPAIIWFEYSVIQYFMLCIVTAVSVYLILMISLLKLNVRVQLSFTKIGFCKYLRNYWGYIKSGFIMNVSTVMTFLFFYMDRVSIRENHPEYLADYSLSFAIMQMTVVAITTFSYVNIVEFGKSSLDAKGLKVKVVTSLKRCFVFYVALGGASIVFSFAAEAFYGYKMVFETTSIMVMLFGLASVFSSVNSLYLYLDRINVLAIFTLVALFISILLSWNMSFLGESGYYFLLFKTYGVFLLLTIVSIIYIVMKLQAYGKLELGER